MSKGYFDFLNTRNQQQPAMDPAAYRAARGSTPVAPNLDMNVAQQPPIGNQAPVSQPPVNQTPPPAHQGAVPTGVDPKKTQGIIDALSKKGGASRGTPQGNPSAGTPVPTPPPGNIQPSQPWEGNMSVPPPQDITPQDPALSGVVTGNNPSSGSFSADGGLGQAPITNSFMGGAAQAAAPGADLQQEDDNAPIPGQVLKEGEPPAEQMPIWEDVNNGLASNEPGPLTDAVGKMGDLDEGHIPPNSPPGKMLRYANTNFLRGSDGQGNSVYECPLSKKPCGRQTFWQRLKSFFQTMLGLKDQNHAQAEVASLDSMDPITQTYGQGNNTTQNMPQAQVPQAPPSGFMSGAPAYQSATQPLQ